MKVRLMRQRLDRLSGVRSSLFKAACRDQGIHIGHEIDRRPIGRGDDALKLLDSLVVSSLNGQQPGESQT
ncbi:hypothetical protein D3C73_1617140 [compost metagenome]